MMSTNQSHVLSVPTPVGFSTPADPATVGRQQPEGTATDQFIAQRQEALAARGRATPVVLVADNEPVTRRMLRQLVESAGYRVLEVESGRQAISRMSDDVAVVLLDPTMPDVSGVEVLRHVRQRFPEIQVIMVSETAEISDAVASIKQGAFEYLTKPWDREELLTHIGRAVRASEMARQRSRAKPEMGYPNDKTYHNMAAGADQVRSSPRETAGSEELGLAGMTMAEIERRAIIETLRALGGARGKTARRLGISEKTLYNKIKKYDLAKTIQLATRPRHLTGEGFSS